MSEEKSVPKKEKLPKKAAAAAVDAALAASAALAGNRPEAPAKGGKERPLRPTPSRLLN